MKIPLVFVCTCAIISIKKSSGSAIGTPFYPLNPDDLSEGDIKEYFDYQRSKRSLEPILGSAGTLIQLKTALVSGTRKKIIEIAQGSASNALKGVGSAIGGSSGGIHQIKSALTAEIQRKIAQIAKSSAGAITAGSSGAGKAAFNTVSGSASAVKQLHSAALGSLVQGIGNLVSGSSKNTAGAAHRIKSAALNGISQKINQLASSSGNLVKTVSSSSSSGLHSLKSSVVSGFTNKIGHIARSSAGLISAGSATIGNAGKSLTELLTNSVNAVNQLKTNVKKEISNQIRKIASGSANVASSASSGLHTKVTQVSKDIVVGGADVANHLKSAVVAGTKQKLGQAASSVTGALTAAVGSASAGVGQLTRGVVIESTNLVNTVKSAILQEAQKKLGQITSASAGASSQVAKSSGTVIQGSGNALHQLKSSFISGLTSHISKLASGSVSGIGQASRAGANAVNQVKHHVSNSIGNIARGSATAISGASSQANNLKTNIKNTLVSQLGQLARGSLNTVTGASNQIKTAAISHITNTAAQASRGSVSAIAGSANAVYQLKTAAVKHIAEKIRQVSTGSITGASKLSSGASSTIHSMKSAAIKTATGASGRIARSSSSNIANASQNVVNGLRSTISGTAGAVHQLVEGIEGQISNIAEASAKRRKRSIDGFPAEANVDEIVADLSKRSDPWSSGPNSGDILNQLKLAVVSGLKQKFAQVAKGSAGAVAGASAGFSKGSFSGDSKSIHYDSHPHVDEDKHIDTWDIKKSVLNTLLQAVKAIKGGVLAIKGQLIKGSGYVVAGSGKLLAAGGDKVTSLGKNILSNVVLVHPGHEHYVPHDHGHHPSGPTIVYEPSGPSSSSHGYESHYDSHPYDHHSDKLHGNPAGIIILRKIPATHDKYHSSPSHIDHSVISTYKPTSGPTFGTVVGKFFTAATSLNPSGPAPFSDEDFHNYHHDEGQSFVEEARHQHNEPAPIFQAPVEEDHLQPPEPPSTNYGVPVNDYQSFNNINDHLGAESSAVNEQKIKLTKGEILDHLETSPTLASTEIKVPKDAPQSLQDLKHSVNKKQPTLRVPFSSDYLPQNTLAVSQIVSNSHELNLPSPSDSLTSFLPKEETESFSTFHDQSNEPSSKEQYMKFIGNFPYYKTPIAPPTFKSSNSKDYLSQKMKMLRLQSEQRHRSRPDYKLVKSVSYEITPHGAKRLT